MAFISKDSGFWDHADIAADISLSQVVLDGQIIDRVKALLDGVDLGDSVTAFRSGSGRLASFESGILYDVQPNAQFAEVPYKALSGHPKPGHLWTGQNRPLDSDSGR